MNDDPAGSTLRLGYLTSQYPATSHTFISREVAAVRQLGIALDTFSIRPPSSAELKDELIRSEANETFIILHRPAAELLTAHVAALCAGPARYFRTLIHALGHRPPGVKGLALSIAHFAEAILLARELKRRGVTHLHNHFANSAATVGYLTTYLLKIPWSFTMHGISETDYPAGLLLGRKIEAAAFVACVSYFGRAQAMRLIAPACWEKLKIVRCGLPLDRLPRRSTAQRDQMRLVCVGRLSPEKGQVGLIRAFATVALQEENVELVLVGDGPEYKALRQLATDLDIDGKVTFAGRLGEIETLNEIARADILVLPSFMEGLPIVLMEAMAIGTAVIASRVAGIPELVEDGESGVLFTPSDWDALSASIRRLADDKALRERLQVSARRRVAEEFDVHRSARQLVRLFRLQMSS